MPPGLRFLNLHQEPPSGVSLQLLRVDLSQLEHVIITPSTPESVSGEPLVEADLLPGSGASGPLFRP